MIEHEHSEEFAAAVARARRFQHERLERVVADAGARGLSLGELQVRLSWPLDSVDAWLTEALDTGAIAVAPGHEGASAPRYVTVANLGPIEQADGGAP